MVVSVTDKEAVGKLNSYFLAVNTFNLVTCTNH